MTAVDDRPMPSVEPRRGLWHRLYHGETTFDFYGKRWIGFGISGVLLVLTVVSLFTRGLNLGIDFEGGVAWEVPAAAELTVDRAETILEQNGVDPADAKVQTLSGAQGERLRVQVGVQTPEVQTAVRGDLAEVAGVDPQDVSVTSVSSTWGEEITRKALRALVVFLVVVAIYISIRFEWRMAVGALAAVAHDVILTVGIYSLTGFEVTPATVIAFLTILGFSLYDTIVVFDKVQENTRRIVTSRASYADVMNLSMNQVLMRSLNTSIAAMLPVVSLLVVGSWIMGAVALQDFALALLIGLLLGSYSSIFIASPIVVLLHGGDTRSSSSRVPGARRSPVTTPVGAATSTTDGEGATATGASSTTPTATTPTGAPTGLSHPPRPRKKRRR